MLLHLVVLAVRRGPVLTLCSPTWRTSGRLGSRDGATLLERVYTVCCMLLSAEDAGRALRTRPTNPWTVGADPWDRVLDAVCGRYRQHETSGPEIAATITAKVHTYWDTKC